MDREENGMTAPPGAVIREKLNIAGMLQKELAFRMGMTEKHVSKLINGEVQLTCDVAMRLETVFGTPASTWNALEAGYRESLLRVAAEECMDADIELAQCFPYGEMARLGWVPEARDVKAKVYQLRRFFEVVELSLLEKWQLSGIAGKSLSLRDEGDLAVVAWTQAARRKARKAEVSPVAGKGLGVLLPKLRDWTQEKPNDFLPKLKSALADYGIVLLFLPRLKGLSLQAATFMAGNKIVIALTAKKMDDAEFWFRLFHELAHVFLGHVSQGKGTTEQDERDANLWAKNALLPRKEFDAFRQGGSYGEKSVRKFAAEQGIAPGIVAGRMQQDGIIGGGALNHLKRECDFGMDALELFAE